MRPSSRSPFLLSTVLLAWAAMTTPAAERLTYVDLVERSVDLRHLAVLPAPGERCQQWSSYDRRSRYDLASGRYLEWDANGDGDGFIRKDGDRFVLAEMEGPGCIWRIWSAAPKEGRVRIYLDGAEEPAVDLPFTGYFDGKHPPFDRPTLVHTTALGCNNYTPIPYRKSCRIVAEPNWGQYFQFVYSTFPKDTEVPTFRRRLSSAENESLSRADRIAGEPGPRPPSPGTTVSGSKGRLEPGQEYRFRVRGPAAITQMKGYLGLDGTIRDRTVLREVTLAIHWDGETRPSVWSPWADFFGTAAGANVYRSLPCGLTEDGTWYCGWYMPFAEGAEVVVRNDGTEPRTFQLEAYSEPLPGDPSRYGRFHAKWHRNALPPSEPERAIDWTLLKVTGRGRFVGVMLHVWNPRGAWWGEGDEKFFVDGEKFPSTFGTGSEDYFGYAWCNPGLFENAYHNQTISMNNKGHVSVNRWHVGDNIPFQTSFEGAIEKYFPDSRPTLYAATAYWYAAAGTGGHDPYEPVSVAERARYWDDELVPTLRVRGALEGEGMKVLSAGGGGVQTQDMSGFEGQWSGDNQLWWTGGKPGDRLVLAVPVAEGGRYRIRARFTRAIDYGMARFGLDGAALGGVIDFFHDGVVATEELDLGTRRLDAGEHRFEIELTGAHPKAVPAHMIGLDYLRLEPVP